MNKHTRKPRPGRPARAAPRPRRADARDGALAFLAALEAIRRRWLDLIMAEGEGATSQVIEDRAADALRAGIRDVHQAAAEAEAALAELLRPFDEIMEDLRRLAAATAALAAWPARPTDGGQGSAALLAAAVGIEAEGAASADALERWQERGLSDVFLAALGAAGALWQERGCRTDEPIAFASACELLAPDEQRLDSFIGAYQFVVERGEGMSELGPFVAREVSEGRWEGLLAAAIRDEARARTVLAAYQEASAVLVQAAREVYPAAFAPAYWLYYAGRRCAYPPLVDEARRRILHGGGESPDSVGPLHQWIRRRYRGLGEPDFEAVADACGEAFLRALDGLPVEVLLAPALAIKWALTAAGWAGNRALPKRWVSVLSPDEAERNQAPRKRRASIPWPDQVIVDDEHDRSLERYGGVPDLELLERRYVRGEDEGDLAAALGISRDELGVRLRRARAAVAELAPRPATAVGRVRGRPDRLAAAVDWLGGYLRDGPRLQAEVSAAAESAGIGPTWLRRAKRQLGVESRRRGNRGRWIWALPTA